MPDVGRKILVTAHRRENQEQRLVNVCNAIKRIRDEFPDVVFTFPLHPNPRIKSMVAQMLGDQPRIFLTPPLDYPLFVKEMMQSYFILTDSGGIQEEAPYLRKPVLVMRDRTERPEVIEHGVARLDRIRGRVHRPARSASCFAARTATAG